MQVDIKEDIKDDGSTSQQHLTWELASVGEERVSASSIYYIK